MGDSESASIIEDCLLDDSDNLLPHTNECEDQKDQTR